jgi:hypothetical protein
MSIKFELQDGSDITACNFTMLDVYDGVVFVGAVTDRNGKQLLAMRAGDGSGAGVVAMLDQDDVYKLQQALAWACQAHGGRPALGVLSW